MKKILIISLAIILNSCMSSMKTVSLNHREYDGIKEGLIYKDLGEPLIARGIEKYSKGIRMESPVNKVVYQYFGIVYSVNLRNGEILYLGGTDNSREFYFSDNNVIVGNFTYKQGVALNKKTNKKYVFFSQGTKLMDKEYDVKYSETEYHEKDCNECFEQELIYNGKSGNTIKVIYREFYGNSARPDYTQNLNYDLEDGDLISFKGCKIKVLNAKNTGIEFKILSTFN